MSSATAVPAPRREQYTPLNKVQNLQELFENIDFRKRIEQAIPKHMSGERLLRTMVLAVQKTPKLLKVSPFSMMGAFITVASLGLEPNTPLQHAHLIPFDVKKWNPATRQREVVRTDVNLIIGYQGYADLMYRSDRIRDFECNVVWQGDEFDYEYGTRKHLHHKRGKQAPDKGEMPDYAYIFTRFANGGEHFEVMNRADVETIRGRSQAYRNAMYAHDDAIKQGKDPLRDAAYSECPWIKDPIPMWRKTALRAGQKWLPKSVEMGVAIGLDEASDRGAVDFGKVLSASSVMDGAWESEPGPGEGGQEQTPGAPTVHEVRTGAAEESGSHPLVDPWGELLGYYVDAAAWLAAYKTQYDKANEEQAKQLAEHNADGLAWAGAQKIAEKKGAPVADREPGQEG